MKRKMIWVLREDTEIETRIVKAGTPVVFRGRMGRTECNVRLKYCDTGLDEWKSFPHPMPLYTLDLNKLKRTYVSVRKYNAILKSFDDDQEKNEKEVYNLYRHGNDAYDGIHVECR